MRTSHVHVWSRQISVQLLHNVGPWYRITSDLTRCGCLNLDSMSWILKQLKGQPPCMHGDTDSMTTYKTSKVMRIVIMGCQT